MEGVNTVMPMAIKTGVDLVGGVQDSGSSGGVSEAAERRARAVEAQAQRQAEAKERSTREQVQQLREDSQHKNAAARVAAANSGLTLSGSSLLNLTSLEHAGDEKVGKVLGESALQVQSLLDTAADQARSIRLSGRVAGSRSGGLGSLLRLGGLALGGQALGRDGTPSSAPVQSDW